MFRNLALSLWYPRCSSRDFLNTPGRTCLFSSPSLSGTSGSVATLSFEAHACFCGVQNLCFPTCSSCLHHLFFSTCRQNEASLHLVSPPSCHLPPLCHHPEKKNMARKEEKRTNTTEDATVYHATIREFLLPRCPSASPPYLLIFSYSHLPIFPSFHISLKPQIKDAIAPFPLLCRLELPLSSAGLHV